MSKGWESKSVEEQQAERAAMAETATKGRGQNVDGQKARARQALELQREQILSTRTSNPHRRVALEAALAEIEERLAALDGA
ncbi:MAG TPA: hypothetical protein VGM02_13665 [Acidobacteriaceae bacterium]|jgi:hypothetical protein